jgi:8-oxo-dGTP pyrophosphatase MutT (NUDIX family)
MDLRAVLLRHAPADTRESDDLQRIVRFVSTEADPFDRRIPHAHLTGSAFVVSADGARVLLLHHRKLERWLQPGGHADAGESSGETVALREAREETGIRGLVLHPRAPRPLDVDVHDIPARRDEPAHQHLDLRYLVVAPAAALPTPGPGESVELRWFAWEEAAALDLDAGLRRGLAKARAFWPGTLGR